MKLLHCILTRNSPFQTWYRNEKLKMLIQFIHLIQTLMLPAWISELFSHDFLEIVEKEISKQQINFVHFVQFDLIQLTNLFNFLDVPSGGCFRMEA